jgi:superfamily I DNA/RNA helicase
MAEIGLAPGEVHVVIVLAGRQLAPTEVGSLVVVGEKQAAKYINSHGRRLTDSQVNSVLSAALNHFPVLGEAPAELDLSILPQALPEAEPEVLLTVDDVTEVLMAGVLAESIESWMSFLHPTQAKLVRRSFSGPSRIRGAAGTGKTVVGLHRAAYLARSQEKKVLVTSFVKTLPDVLSNLMTRLAPEVADRVEFAGVHAFALGVLRGRGMRVNLKSAEVTLAFNTAWQQHGLGGVLEQIDRDKRYWEDEISKVIKGRGLTTFDEYSSLPRTGRRRGLTLDQRRAVWTLFLAYQEGLRSRGIHDFDDVILLAEQSLRAHPLDSYGAVVIDEAQDLSCAMVRMLHLLVGDAPDGLTIIGDGQQSIYPGGFTLSEAGISIAGRGVVMSTNYRNTREIVEFAARSVDGDQFADIEGELQTKDAVTEVVRSGAQPVLERFDNRAEHDRGLLDQVKRAECSRADIGILCLTTAGVTQALKLLEAVGIPAIDLADYSGKPVDAVKVGTVKRAKGLEFKTVLMPRVLPAWIEPSTRDDEAHAIHRRELYVAMTRARDELWVGVCS